MVIVKFVGFDYMSNSLIAEIKRNITALLETPEGTCPGDRAYGIRQDFVGMPIGVARNLAALAVIEKFAELRDGTIEASVQDGHIKNIYLIGPNTEYDAESEESEDAEETDEE